MIIIAAVHGRQGLVVSGSYQGLPSIHPSLPQRMRRRTVFSVLRLWLPKPDGWGSAGITGLSTVSVSLHAAMRPWSLLDLPCARARGLCRPPLAPLRLTIRPPDTTPGVFSDGAPPVQGGHRDGRARRHCIVERLATYRCLFRVSEPATYHMIMWVK